MESKRYDNCPTHEWNTIDPSSLKVDTLMLATVDDFIKNNLKSVNSVLIIKDGGIVFEKNYNGFSTDTASHVASITKSVMSILVGIAIDVGFIRSLDQKLVEFFPEVNFIKKSPFIREITLRHLLTMTSGITYSDCSIVSKNANWLDYIFDYDIKKTGTFLYNDINSHLLSVIITKSSGLSTHDFADKSLFHCMGINVPKTKTALISPESPKWLTDINGYNTGGWGLSLSSRDLAKFGMLYLNNGMWNDYMVISEPWVLQSTREQVRFNDPNRPETGYGYYWWTSNIANNKIYFARGTGEQYLIVCPHLDMIAVFKNQENSIMKTSLFDFWATHLLPLFV